MTLTLSAVNLAKARKSFSRCFRRMENQYFLDGGTKKIFLHIVMKVALFYTKNRDESTTFLNKKS
jgi:hypothetical protein